MDPFTCVPLRYGIDSCNNTVLKRHLYLHEHAKLENLLIVKIFNKLNSLIQNKKMIFCWIPSHIGIQSNDKANLTH